MVERADENEASPWARVDVAVRAALAAHFVMWHTLPAGGAPGEWRCACGLKFGFSDAAIDHQADAVAIAIGYDHLLPEETSCPEVLADRDGNCTACGKPVPAGGDSDG